jgi:ectoine hydroxylase-related dioxygenase (phytanoyl-CoA dioxygenase family)
MAVPQNTIFRAFVSKSAMAPVTDGDLPMSEVPLADTFQFDAQGYIVLRGVFDAERCRRYLTELDRLFELPYEDAWLQRDGVKGQTTVQLTEGQRRLNGLPLWTDVFDEVITLAPVVDRLRAWMQAPQLVNTWAIDKTQGTPWGGWHRGLNPDDYSVRNGKVRTRMLNCVYLLTDNGADDGCLAVVPGAHKSEVDLPMAEYRNRELPGMARITGKAGDVVMLSETLLHTGTPKTTSGHRTNLYFNFIDATYNPAIRELLAGNEGNINHYVFPAEVRARFDATQSELTRWMEWQRTTPANAGA